MIFRDKIIRGKSKYDSNGRIVLSQNIRVALPHISLDSEATLATYLLLIRGFGISVSFTKNFRKPENRN